MLGEKTGREKTGSEKDLRERISHRFKLIWFDKNPPHVSQKAPLLHKLSTISVFKGTSNQARSQGGCSIINVRVRLL